MSSTMLAALYKPGETRLSLEQVARPTPGEGEVLLRIQACGACHSDLFILDIAGAQHYPRSFIMGHEACGDVVALGVGADAELGALYCVHITGTKPPGRTATQLENTFGLGIDGAYAQFAVVPQAALVRVPTGVPAALAAVAADAGTTTWRAVHGVAQVLPGQRVLILGVGGLGLLAVQLAVLAGAGVVSVSDVRPHALELAAGFGAAHTFSPESLNAAIADGFSVDVVIDFVSTPATFRAARESLRQVGAEVGRSGRLVVVGVGHEAVQLSLMDIILTPIEILPTLYGSKDDLANVLDLIAQNKLHMEVQQSALEDINTVLDELRRGTVRSRMVVVPPTVDMSVH